MLRVSKAESPPFRPSISTANDAEVDPAMVQLMNDCWKEDPELRPFFKQVRRRTRFCAASQQQLARRSSR